MIIAQHYVNARFINMLVNHDAVGLTDEEALACLHYFKPYRDDLPVRIEVAPQTPFYAICEVTAKGCDVVEATVVYVTVAA